MGTQSKREINKFSHSGLVNRAVIKTLPEAEITWSQIAQIDNRKDRHSISRRWVCVQPRRSADKGGTENDLPATDHAPIQKKKKTRPKGEKSSTACT